MKNLFFLFLFSLVAMSVRAQSFTGEKTDWHGFDRYDFVTQKICMNFVLILWYLSSQSPNA